MSPYQRKVAVSLKEQTPTLCGYAAKGNIVDKCHQPDIANTFSSGGWKRAARCGPDGGNCVEVMRSVTGLVAVRDSKRLASPTLTFDDDQWCCFMNWVCAGRYTAVLPPTHSSAKSHVYPVQ